MAQGSRPQRLGEQIRAELTQLVARQVHDPHIGFLTVTSVDVSADLHHARVHYTVLGPTGSREATAHALGRVTPFLRRQIAHRLNLRRMPELRFEFDDSIERQDRIQQLLQSLHTEDPSDDQT